MKKLLAALIFLPAISFATCDKIKGDWLGKTNMTGTQKTYAIDVDSKYIGVTELEIGRAVRTIWSSYRVVDCQMEFLMWNTDNGNANVILNLTNESGMGFIDDAKGRHFLEITK
jgi:hypothetical protein